MMISKNNFNFFFVLETLKDSEILQYTHFSSWHPPWVKKGYIKGEAFRQFSEPTSETAFKTAISQFKTNPIERGYLETLVSKTLSEITFEERKPALQKKPKQDTRILPFVA